jgi:hypothetical protein
MAVTQAAPPQLSSSVLMAMVRLAAYPESHPTEAETDGILRDFRAKGTVFLQMCGYPCRNLLCGLALFFSIQTSRPASRNAVVKGFE